MTEIASAGSLLPPECFWVALDGHLRVARKVGGSGDDWLLDIYRNPAAAHTDDAMLRAGSFTPL